MSEVTLLVLCHMLISRGPLAAVTEIEAVRGQAHVKASASLGPAALVT